MLQLYVLQNFVDLRSNLALLYNKGHNFWKSVLTWKFRKTEYFPTKIILSLSSRTCKFSSWTCKLYFPPWIHFIEYYTALISIRAVIFISLQQFILPYSTYWPYCNPLYLRLSSRTVSQVGKNKVVQRNKNYFPS